MWVREGRYATAEKKKAPIMSAHSSPLKGLYGPVVGCEVRIHPENARASIARTSGRHGVQYVAQSCAALTLNVWQ